MCCFSGLLWLWMLVRCVWSVFFFSSRRRHTRCALVTGVQTCALPISRGHHVQMSGKGEVGTLALMAKGEQIFDRAVRGVAADEAVDFKAQSNQRLLQYGKNRPGGGRD